MAANPAMELRQKTPETADTGEPQSPPSPRGSRAFTIDPTSRLARVVKEEIIHPEDLVGLTDEKCNIGSGSFGVVRKVAWRKTPVAAKVAHNMLPEQKQLFLRELEVMVRLRHPNVVQFLGYVDKPFVIVMEYLPCGDLRAYCKTRRVSVSHKSRICVDVLRALTYLHNRKPSSIIHRDVKPTNVLMTRSGVAKLTDFGLGRFTIVDDDTWHGGMHFDSKHSGSAYEDSRHGGRSPPLTPGRRRSMPPVLPSQNSPVVAAMAAAAVPPKMTISGTLGAPTQFEGWSDATAVVGTAPYMAPEANKHAYDEKVGIYSAAITFYELFEQSRFVTEIPFGWALTPSRFRSVILEMGAEDPKERPTALELIDRFGGGGDRNSYACVVC